jgi:hypothetical protein
MLEETTRNETSDVPPPAAEQMVCNIAICGSNPTTIDEAPFGDPSWRIWACSPDNTPFGLGKLTRELPRVDERFELHVPIADESRPFGYLQHISKDPIVWLRDERALPHFPGGRMYPEAKLKGTSKFQRMQVHQNGGVETRICEIPNGDGKYCAYCFTSSISYMLAKAINDLEGVRGAQIGLWGIIQATDGEYSYQRPGIQYFLYEATKRGIKVIANRESCLFDMPQWKW